MKFYDVPAHVVSPETDNITSLLLDRISQTPDIPLMSIQDASGDWADMTASEFRDDVEAVAKGLIASGIQPGQAVAIMSRTRYEWTLIDFAIWYAGAVSVPIYETSAPTQIEWILADSDAVALFVERSELAQRYEQIKSGQSCLIRSPISASVLRRVSNPAMPWPQCIDALACLRSW